MMIIRNVIIECFSKLLFAKTQIVSTLSGFDEIARFKNSDPVIKPTAKAKIERFW